jgi:CSLREA domain-containing protein
MKIKYKSILTVFVLSTMSLMAAEDYTIYVTTFDDEDGTNNSKCSLREALTAASTNRAYGGCPKGQPYTNLTNVIQLEKGVYKLNKELQPNSSVRILGHNPIDYSKRNVISGNYPYQSEIETTIDGQGQHRIFNTTNLNRPNLTLANLKLINGNTNSNGGALFLGGITDLTNVYVLNSKALSGGAIYLNDSQSAVKINGGWLQNNKAKNGSVISMACLDNLVYSKRRIDISHASITDNGDQSSLSTFAFCGEPTVNFEANTLSGNQANSSTGHIIQFSNKLSNNDSVSFSKSSFLSLLSNTIVKNTAKSMIFYGFEGSKGLYHNVIGFNNGKTCAYSQGDVAPLDGVQMILFANALSLTNQTTGCEITDKAKETAVKDNLEIDGLSFNQLFVNEQPLINENTNYIPMYFPRDRGEEKDLVDFGQSICSVTDQRNIVRLPRDNLDATTSKPNTCDIGSTEVLRLTIGNLSKTNESMVALVDSYETQIESFEESIKDPKTKPELMSYLKLRLDELKIGLEATKNLKLYRPILIDPFTANLPDEFVSSDGRVREIKHLNADNYQVTVESVGVGRLDQENKFIGIKDNRLVCKWNEDLKQVVMYRTDGRITPSGDSEFCQYTLTSKTEPNKSSSAYLIGSFINIIPIVEPTIEYTINPKVSTLVDVDVLAKANDDGDGDRNAIVSGPKKTAFYHNIEGKELAIRFNDIPDPVSVIAERQGPCPDDRFKTCFGGRIQVQLNNNLDVFPYKLNYSVIDADGEFSDVGLLHIKNTETGPDSVRSKGGSVGFLSLIGMFGLILIRRKLF